MVFHVNSLPQILNRNEKNACVMSVSFIPSLLKTLVGAFPYSYTPLCSPTWLTDCAIMFCLFGTSAFKALQSSINKCSIPIIITVSPVNNVIPVFCIKRTGSLLCFTISMDVLPSPWSKSLRHILPQCSPVAILSICVLLSENYKLIIVVEIRLLMCHLSLNYITQSTWWKSNFMKQN